MKIEDLPPTTLISDKISKDMKKLGFKFVGSTIIYAFMQATGMVNDHITKCFTYKELTSPTQLLTKPQNQIV
jgi:DNA-3-methyladenine glycosylase I